MHNPELITFVKQAFPKPGKALDLGCGKGEDIRDLQKLGWQTEGVDLTMGVDLNQPFLSQQKPFNLIFSNYTIQKLQKPEVLLETINNNLAPGGFIFIHTFAPGDEVARRTFSPAEIKDMLQTQKFALINIRTFRVFDDEPGHPHWHHVLEATAQKDNK